MFQKTKISPSILSADQCNLRTEVEKIERAGASFVHIDVMDGHFVPNLTFGIPLIKSLKEITSLPLDVHLMIANPLEQIDWYLDAGSDMITVHTEAASIDELALLASKCHRNDVKFAVAIKPNTPTSVLDDIIADCDMVLAMSVEPGFSGQKFMPSVIDKIAEICAIAAAHNVEPLIQVDGGIGVGAAVKVCAAGADVLVAGNAIFANEDYGKVITAIKVDAEAGRTAGLKKREALLEFGF